MLFFACLNNCLGCATCSIIFTFLSIAYPFTNPVPRYFTEWALTLFSRGFSFDLVTRVWDVLMNEGSYKIVYRVSLGLLKYFEAELLELKFDKIMALLRDLPRHIDASKLMEVSASLPCHVRCDVMRCGLYSLVSCFFDLVICRSRGRCR